MVPLGKTFLADRNPGAHRRVSEHRFRRGAGESSGPIPYELRESVRREVFTPRRAVFRRGAPARLRGALRAGDLPLRRLQRRPLGEPQRGLPERWPWPGLPVTPDGDLITPGGGARRDEREPCRGRAPGPDHAAICKGEAGLREDGAARARIRLRRAAPTAARCRAARAHRAAQLKITRTKRPRSGSARRRAASALPRAHQAHRRGPDFGLCRSVVPAAQPRRHPRCRATTEPALPAPPRVTDAARSRIGRLPTEARL